MDRKQKIMIRVKDCYNRIATGAPVRNAYRDAHIDAKTYNNYLDEYISLSEEEKNKIPQPNYIKTPAPAAPQQDTKKHKPLKFLVTITDPDCIEHLLNESHEESTPIAIIGRKYIVKRIRDKYKK